MSLFSDAPNPYQTPTNPYQPSGGSSPGARPLPVYVLVVLIMDLLLLALRALLVLFGLFALTLPQADPMVLQTGVFEVLCGGVMVLFGVVGNAAMLMKQRWGVWLGVAKVLATIGSLGVALWQVSFFVERFQPGTPEFVGLLIGASIPMLIRLGLMAIYIHALTVFWKWANADASAPRY